MSNAVLEIGQVEILGVHQYNKENAKGVVVTNTTIYYRGLFSDYEFDNGAYGFKCGSEFTRITVPVLNVGDICELRYEKGFQDRATLSGINVIVGKIPFEKEKSAK